MQSTQRQLWKLRSKGPGNNAKVSVLLSDFEDADKLLAKIIEDAKLWREAWVSLTATQFQVVSEFDALYDPIVGHSEGQHGGRTPVPTPEIQLHRTFRLKEAYGELRTELADEIVAIESAIVHPAGDARESISPIRKTIKKRENKRLDYEKAQDKVAKLQKKHARNPKEEAALAKAQEEMTRTADEFTIADDHLRQTLPPIIAAAFSIVPPLLAALVTIQNRLLGLYYTTLHDYCEELGFPSPPPPMDDVIATFDAAYKPAQSQLESISFIARGKAIHQHVDLAKDPTRRPSVAPPRTPSSSSALIPSTGNALNPRTMRIPSTASISSTPPPSNQPSPAPVGARRPDYLSPTDFTTASMLGGATIDRITPGSSPSNLDGRQDSSFSTNSSPRASTASLSRATTGGTSYSSNAGGGIIADQAARKKKPPPPPPKRVPTAPLPPEDWVVARFAFQGQGKGDLSFREGDRIRVVRRTDTEQDWWDGQVNGAGATGSFPANYCRQT